MNANSSARRVQITESSAVPGTNGLHPARVLLVDDNKGDILLARIALLGPKGVRCDLTTAQSGHEAMQVLQEASADAQPIDLALLDINMPGEGGFGLLNRIRGFTSLRRMPVIMCSGSDNPLDQANARDLGVVGYLVKPPCVDKLQKILDQIPTLELVRSDLETTLWAI